MWRARQNKLKRRVGPGNRSKLLATAAAVVFALVLGGLVVTMVMFAYFAKDLPSPDRVVRRDGFATKIHDRNGELLYDVFSDVRRTPVEIGDVPLSLRQATIAIEDKSFYKHQGVDILTPLRIAWNLVVRRRVVGGSTLTQQLVKNVLLSPERTPTRKIKEFILTLQVERKYSKDQILQMYLNEVPYGGTAWGVEAASETYFGKPVSEVNLAESVILAGLPQSPSRYSPLAGKGYISRATDVLRRMREDGYITSEQEKETIAQLDSVPIASQSGLLKAPHFVFYIREQLIDRYGERVVEEGGLRVTTSLDLKLQEEVQKTVSEEIEKVKHLNITNGAAMVMDPRNGHILAMVGSRGWEDPDYDGKYNVTTALRQPGSAIKPVVYLTGLREGYSAASLLMDVKTPFSGGSGQPDYVPENYDGKFRGPVLVRDALGNSLNIPAVKMVALVGIQDMLQTGYEMGFTTLKPTKELLARVGLSVALGGGEVRLIDMTTAYSAFANGGKKVEPVAILKVTDSSGKVLEEWKEAAAREVITPEEAYIMSSILSDPNARKITFGSRSALDIAGKTVAVKTGTTNDKRDNWTVGWTPSVMVGVWVGNNNNSAMKQVASGVTGASPIWRRIILKALEGKTDEPFTKPEGVVEVEVDQISGYRAHDGFPAKKEVFIKGTEPDGEDPVHKKIKVCKGEGKLATIPDIASGNYEEKEGLYFKEEDPFQGTTGKNRWQEGVLEWLNTQAEPKFHPPTELCGSTNPLWITIKEPADKSRINGNDVRVKVEIEDPNKVTKVEVILDGEVKHIFTDAPYEITIPNVTNGVHRIDVKARDEKGFDGSRFVGIGVNTDWKE